MRTCVYLMYIVVSLFVDFNKPYYIYNRGGKLGKISGEGGGGCRGSQDLTKGGGLQ